MKFKGYSKLFIGGKWQSASSNQTLKVVNPANGEWVATVPKANELDVDKAVSAANLAFESWSRTSAQDRAEIILKAADLMLARAPELGAAITATMGCPKSICKDIQVLGAIEAFKGFSSKTGYVEEVKQHSNFIQMHEPIGTCVLINPWNYPLSQLIGKVGAALAVGATVVVKPAEQTPLQDMILADILDEAGLPAGVFNLLTGDGSEIGSYLCSHPSVDMVSFTGSTAAGIKVAQAAAPSVKRVCQELGGKSPLIITQDADLETAVSYGVADVMINSGQTCCSFTRMLVHESQLLKVESFARKACEAQKVGDPTDDAVSMGPLSSISQQQRVRDYIQIGIEEGAKLVTGGAELPVELAGGAYVLPTVFSNVTPNMRIAKEEIFGPVLSILTYKTLDEAIEIANNTEFGLASAVYAKDAVSALEIAKQIRAGQCYIQGNYFNSDAPFGGYKQSGNGREWGEEGLNEFIETKAIITA